MGPTMAWSNFSKSDPVRVAAEFVDAAVTAYRNRGHSRTDAMDQAALALGISPRRAKALVYGEAFAMATEELRAIKSRFIAHLDDQMAHHEAEKQKLRERLQQMRLEGL